MLNKYRYLIVLIAVVGLVQSAFAFSDVTDLHKNTDAIGYLQKQGVIKGYPDGSFRPERLVNRAEFTKIIIEAKNGGAPVPENKDCFPDVRNTDWFSDYICYAKEQGIINGYPDGKFKPADNINLAEAVKILVNTLSVEKVEPSGADWFSQPLESMSALKYIPDSFSYYGQPVSRGQMAEMTWRIMEKVSAKASKDPDGLNTPCQVLDEDLPPGIEMDRVKDAWLIWTNEARAITGLEPYVLNGQLSRTAINWSNFCRNRGYMDHKRPGTSAYYDYRAITDWFKKLGLEFKNINTVTHTENIAWGIYECEKPSCSCKQPDCTADLINAIRGSFDAYMAEKSANGAHYRSIMNEYFKEIGIGLAIDESTNKYYLTIHYGTEIISDPPPLCSS